MRTTITRKLVETTIHGYTIEMNDDVPTVKALDPITVYGNVTKATARKELERVYGKEIPVTVSKIESEEVQYEIPVDKFIENATRLGKANETAETEN